MEYKISEIQILPISAREGLCGFCQFILNDELKISNCAIYTRRDGSGLRLVYPNTKNNLPTINPISQSLGRFIEKEVEKVYLEFLNKD